MSNSETIVFNWNQESKTGTASLFLNMDILSKYALPQLIYNSDNNVAVYTNSLGKEIDYRRAQQEIDEYKGYTKAYGLSQESLFHESQILYMLIDFMINKNSQINAENIKRKIHNRVYLLKQLFNLENANKYNVIITTKVNQFRYSFMDDLLLKSNVLNHLKEEISDWVKEVSPEIYGLLSSGADEEKLEEAIQTQTQYQIEKMLVVELAKKILKYLNKETICLRNIEQIDPLSVSNQQGNFVYDILTLFKIYKPQERGVSAVKHHDTIRKMIRRSEIIAKDN